MGNISVTFFTATVISQVTCIRGGLVEWSGVGGGGGWVVGEGRWVGGQLCITQRLLVYF